MRSPSLALLALVALAACEPNPRTQVMVEVAAESGVAAQAVRLQVAVRAGGAGELSERADQAVGGGSEPVSFPIRVALVPQSGDASRRFEVSATAFDAAERPIGTVRAVSSFVRGRTLVLRLLLEDCCRPLVCGEEETCRGCMCVTAEVPPETLPPLDPDAGTPRADASTPVIDGAVMSDGSVIRDGGAPRDAWSAPVDAARTDAASPDSGRDAGPPTCPTRAHCAVLPDSFARGARVVVSDPTWTPPLGTLCPASALSRDSHYYVLERLYNPGPGMQTVTLRTLNQAPPEGVANPVLYVYRETMPNLMAFPRLPASLLMCGAINDDFPGTEPNARLVVSVPAGEAVLIVVTTGDPGDVGWMQLNVTSS